MDITEALKAARANSEKKKFEQSVDLIVNIKNLDMKKPESRFSRDVSLPHGSGKQASVCLISDGHGTYAPKIGKDQVSAAERDKKAAKKIVKTYDFFMCEPALMILVGKALGRYLGPTGKMPKPLPPNADPNAIASNLSKSVRVRIKDSPNIQCAVGKESMADEQIVDNAKRVIEEIKKALPAKAQIRNASLKLTMGKPTRFNVV